MNKLANLNFSIWKNHSLWILHYIISELQQNNFMSKKICMKIFNGNHFNIHVVLYLNSALIIRIV